MSDLVVAIEVAALPVGDGHPPAADLAHSFDIQGSRPWLGMATEPEPFGRNRTLARGVHLHWLLPEPLTRGRAADTLEFPVVPDRWRVRRWIVGRPAQSWVVEGDRLWDRPEPGDRCGVQNELSPSVPALPADLTALAPGTRLFRRLGKVFPADGWQEDPHAPRHHPHTALGWGHPAFCAALPHCYNVFGLLDPLSGVPAGPVSYTVVGWWSDPRTVPRLAAELAPHGDITRTMLRGEVLDVAWDPDVVPAPTPHRMQAAIGSSTAEALAALLARQPGPDGQGGLAADEHAERLLTALQFGMLNRLSDTRPGALLEWDAELHRRDFVALPGGTRYELRPLADPATAPTEPSATLTALLAALDECQAAVDALERELTGLREQLFADWSTLQVHRDRDRTYPRGSGRLLRTAAAEVNGLVTRRDAAVRARDDARNQLDTEAGTSHTVVAVAGPRFWRPADPVVLLWGEDTRPVPPVAPSVGGDLDAAPGDERCRWREPWRPVLLSWAAAYRPATPEPVPAGLLLDRYGFDEDDPHDLVDPPGRVDPAAPAPEASPTTITGTVPLNPRPLTELATLAKAHLDATPPAGLDPQVRDDLTALADLVTRLQPPDRPAPPIQSQGLAGLAAALLGRRESIELPVLDPYADDNDLEHSGVVRDAVGGAGTSAIRTLNPQIDPPFHPLRAGTLALTRLWLLDTFGRHLPLLDTGPDADPRTVVDAADIVRAERLAASHDALGRCVLRPRLAQPARLDVRLRLPVVGWLLTHHLDDALAVYGPDGVPLGALDVSTPGMWQRAPGAAADLDAALPAGYLRDLVGAVCAAGPDHLQKMIDTIDDLVDLVLPPDPATTRGCRCWWGGRWRSCGPS